MCSNETSKTKFGERHGKRLIDVRSNLWVLKRIGTVAVICNKILFKKCVYIWD